MVGLVNWHHDQHSWKSVSMVCIHIKLHSSPCTETSKGSSYNKLGFGHDTCSLPLLLWLTSSVYCGAWGIISWINRVQRSWVGPRFKARLLIPHWGVEILFQFYVAILLSQLSLLLLLSCRLSGHLYQVWCVLLMCIMFAAWWPCSNLHMPSRIPIFVGGDRDRRCLFDCVFVCLCAEREAFSFWS